MSHHRIRPDEAQASLLGDDSISKIASRMEKKAHEVWALTAEDGAPTVVRKSEEHPPDPEQSAVDNKFAVHVKKQASAESVVGLFGFTIYAGEQLHGQIVAQHNGSVDIDTPHGILDNVPLGFVTLYPDSPLAYRATMIREVFGEEAPAVAAPILNFLSRNGSRRVAQQLGREIKDWFAGRRFQDKGVDEVAQYLADPGLESGPGARFMPMLDKLLIGELKGNAEARKAIPAGTRAQIFKMIMQRDPVKKKELERIMQWGLHDTGKERGEGWLDRGKQQLGKWLVDKGQGLADKGTAISERGKQMATPPAPAIPAPAAPANPIAPEPLSEREKRIKELEQGQFKGKTFQELHPGAKPIVTHKPVSMSPPALPPRAFMKSTPAPKPKATPPPPPVEDEAPEPIEVKPAPKPKAEEPVVPPLVEAPKPPPEPVVQPKPAEPKVEAPKPPEEKPAEPETEALDPAILKDLGLNPDDYKPEISGPETKPVSDKSTDEQVKEAIDQFEKDNGPFAGAKQRKFEQLVRSILNEVETNRKFSVDDAWKILDEAGLEGKKPEAKEPKVKKDPEVEQANKEQTISKQLGSLQKKLDKAEASDDVTSVAELHGEMASLRRQYKSLTGKPWTKGATRTAADWDPKKPLTPEEQQMISQRQQQPGVQPDPTVKPPPARPPTGMPPQQTDMVGGLFIQHKTDKLRFMDANGNVMSVVEADPGHVAVFHYQPVTILKPLGEPQRMSNDEFNAFAFKNKLQGGEAWGRGQEPGQQPDMAKSAAIENYEDAVVRSYRLGARTRAVRT